MDNIDQANSAFGVNLKYGKIKSYLFLIITILFGICSIVFMIYTIYSYNKYVHITGLVIAYDSTQQIANVQYIRDGMQYTDRIPSLSVTVGSNIPIKYDPKQPRPVALLDNSSSTDWAKLLLIAIIFFVVSYLIRYSMLYGKNEYYISGDALLNGEADVGRIRYRY